ncbi:MAG: hypothetical protein KKA79_09635 [Nanoarchaeota archaeon]|nr:hypothetical protein [Nanoarchaeota archaeon]
MKETQYEAKKRALAAKIKLYHAKLEQKAKAKGGLFKTKEKARIVREHGRWDRKAAKSKAKEAKWNKEWNRRKIGMDVKTAD